MKYLKHISSLRRRDLGGNKARSLSYLSRKGYRIPASWILSAEAFRAYEAHKKGILEQIRREIQEMTEPGITYAVRSSAEKEDNSTFSFAGQFTTILNVKGVEAIIEAIREVWASAKNPNGSEYQSMAAGETQTEQMGVIIQEMVNSKWAGVGFSINPVTGREETILEAVEGSGVKLVQEGARPYRWVYRNGIWDPADPGHSPGKEILDELAKGIEHLKTNLNTEIDVEWAFDGERLFYLQSRAVTARRYPTIYSNHISREFLPGMIKPLVWSINIPLVNGAWIRLLKKIIGPLDLKPEQLSKAFYYRAYFNMGTMGELFKMMGLPRKSLEYLMGFKDPSGKSTFRPGIRTVRYLPRMAWFLLSNFRLGKRFKKWIRKEKNDIAELDHRIGKGFKMDEYDEIFGLIMGKARRAAYFNIIIPLAMQLFNKLLKRKLNKFHIPHEELDFSGDFPLLREYDPQYRIRQLHECWSELPESIRNDEIHYARLESMDGSHALEQFEEMFKDLLEKFGYFSESGNDFSYPHWSEDPDFVLDLVRRGGGKMEIGPELKNDSRHKKRIGRSYRRAGRFRLYREMISAQYTKEYGLFRKLFLKTGEYLASTGMIEAPEDVFYLTLEEHDALLGTKEDTGDDKKMPEDIGQVLQRIEERKKEMQEYENISLPSVIYGEVPPPLALKNETVIHGIPTSPGLFEGRIAVVKGYKDFGKNVDGVVLVIPFADVGWTPILTRAGAIVSESGGMLSHAAIVARELSIPSVSSVDHACSLEDGRMARVDGFNGVVIIDS